MVALRKESVDRNPDWSGLIPLARESLSARRAWIEIPLHDKDVNPDGSLSARRAWIEIRMVTLIPRYSGVALRKESVDRNTVGVGALLSNMKSLSARRAWIEMFGGADCSDYLKSRSPQGERG